MRQRRCLFCGEIFTGQQKNFEHVIPKWLVQEADLKSRTTNVKFGSKKIEAAMGRIGGASCKACNDESSDLETKTKIIYEKIKNGQDISNDDASTFLDWLDKVRIGLWLWLINTGGDHYNFSPNFYINQRRGLKDRIAIVSKYETGAKMKGLGIYGTADHFIFSPNVIGLLCNNIFIISVSSEFILTSHLRSICIQRFVNETKKIRYTVEKSTLPISGIKVLGSPLIFGQCIAPEEIFKEAEIEPQATSVYHPDLFVSSVFKLDSRLQIVPQEIGIVDQISGKPGSHLALMKINVEIFIDYILRDFLKSDFSELSNFIKRQQININLNKYLEETKFRMSLFKDEYRIASGLRLPL